MRQNITKCVYMDNTNVPGSILPDEHPGAGVGDKESLLVVGYFEALR